MTLDRAVIEHYRHGALENVLLNALAAAGKDLDNLTADDLAPADEFHVGGRQATIDFATGLGSAGHPAGGAGIRHNAAAKIAETSWIGA